MSVQMKNCYKMPHALNGSILVKGGNDKKLMMENVLPETLKNKKFELLLRGSEHGLTNKAFNERVKGKGSILVIVLSNEYDRTFGGYTKVGFGKGNPGYQRDEDAFLFYIDPKTKKTQRFGVKNAEKAVHSHDTHYVVNFGGGGLWWVENGKSGTCNRVNYDYSAATNNTLLSGGEDGWTIKDYEVWKVISLL